MTPKAFKRSVWFVVIFIVLAIGVHHLLILGLRQYNAGGSFDVWNQIVGGKAGAEILISGSSRALVNFDCTAISDATGKSCFNIGLDGSKINLDLARFKTYLEHNTKPKVLVQVGGTGDLEFGGLLRLYQYAAYLNEHHLYQSLVSQLPEMRYHKHIPLYTFAIYNKELVWRSVKGLLNRQTPEMMWPVRPRVRGFLPVDIPWTDEFDHYKRDFPQGQAFEISPKGIESFEEMVRLCREQNIQIIMVFPPAYYEATYSYTKNIGEILQAYRDLAKKHDLEFLDYSKIPITRDQKYFYNSQHLNSQGAALFSRLFAEELNAQYLR